MHKNNFDFLRLLFAVLVIITHSYPLSGVPECDILCQVSSGQIWFSYIGLRGFFIISGFLIFESLMRSTSFADYLWKRFLRLFPALLAMLLLTVLLLPFVYQNKAVPYLLNPEVWTYVPKNLRLWGMQKTISGVFDLNTIKDINGSLWTLYYEFLCYILLSFLMLYRSNTVLVKLTVATAAVSMLVGNMFFYDTIIQYGYSPIAGTKYVLDLGFYFVAGSALAMLKKNIPYTVIAILLILSVGAIGMGYFHYIKFIALPVVIIGLGQKATPVISGLAEKIGDLSYGVYIYAFPVQQTLVYLFHLNYLWVMFYTIPIVMVLGYLSWHLIEKRALKFKKLFQ